jgi:L-threonylcarbamoyladenylate synthase
MIPRPATPEAIEEAATLLRAGRLVAFPTETVYGLGADATDARAVAGIFAAKSRPRFNPLIVHVESFEAAAVLGTFGAPAERLARAFWPGPLTLVVAKREACPIADLATAGLPTLALRVPSHPVALALIHAAGRPIAAPSANRSGRVSPTTAAHVAADLGNRVAMILDGGTAPVGVESTVVDATGAQARLLRPGGVTREALEACLGQPLLAPAGGDAARPTAPGQLASHYAPRAAVRLGATTVAAGEALLAFGASVPAHAGPTVNLSPRGDLAEAAANLFAALRTLDASGAPVIAVMPVPETGLGEAIVDRLRRAAAPRDPLPT